MLIIIFYAIVFEKPCFLYKTGEIFAQMNRLPTLESIWSQQDIQISKKSYICLLANCPAKITL